MPSLKNTLLAVAALVVSVVKADYVIDPSTVPISTRNSWCASELSTCPLICRQTPPGTTLVNTCDASTLTYGCVCGNNLQPNISEYSLTLPYFTCQEWGNQCVKGCGQNNECSRVCREGNPCGAQNPTKANVSSTATGLATATGSNTPGAIQSNAIFTGLEGSGPQPTNSPKGNAAASVFALGSSFGLFALMAGLVTGFAYLI